MCFNILGDFCSSFLSVERVKQMICSDLGRRMTLQRKGWGRTLPKEELRPGVRAEGFYTVVFLKVISNLVSAYAMLLLMAFF